MKIYIYKVNSIEEISSNTRWKVLRNNLGYCCLLDGDIMCVFDYYKSFIIFREMEKHNLRCSTYKELDDNIYYEGDDFVFICRYSDEKNMYDKRCWLQKGNNMYDITKGLNEYNKLYNWYECVISDLKPNTEYQIMKFEKTKNGNVVTSICNGYYHPIYVNNKVMNILKKYFKHHDKYDVVNKTLLYCTYNNNKVQPSLTLKTGDEITTDNGVKILSQKICLDLKGIGSYTFYINKYNLINYKKEGRYNFLAMHIYNNNSSYDNNLILGYEFKEKEYYYLKYEEKLILNNINKKIAKNFEEMKKQDLYTYLSSNNTKCGMTISIDENGDIIYKLVKLNDKNFKLVLDISLLKPINKWDEDNNYREPKKFDSIVEGFDEEDINKK